MSVQSCDRGSINCPFFCERYDVDFSKKFTEFSGKNPSTFQAPQPHPQKTPPSPLFYLFHTTQLTSVILTKLLSEQQNFFANFLHILEDFPTCQKFQKIFEILRIFQKMYQIFRKKSIYIFGVPSAPPLSPVPFFCLFHTLQCTSVIFLKLLSGKKKFYANYLNILKYFPTFWNFFKKIFENSKNFS